MSYVYNLREHFDCIYADDAEWKTTQKGRFNFEETKSLAGPRCHLDQILRRRGLHMCYKTPVVTTIAKSNNDIGTLNPIDALD